MSAPDFSLAVIRSRDIDNAAKFYGALGLVFTRHAHGKGPEHYACEIGSVVFEVYPLSPSQPATTGTRLGFTVDDVREAIEQLEQAGGKVITPAKESPWGLRAVMADPDGHRVELTQR